MKNLSILFVLLIVIIISACNNKKKSSADKNETTTDNTITGKENSADNIVSFTANGEKITSSGCNISRFDFGNGAGTCVNVTSNMHKKPRSVNININGDKPGTYAFENEIQTIKKPGVAYGSYTPDFTKNIMEKYSFKDGSFIIESIDTTTGILNGTFSGTVKNDKDKSITISEGKIINGKLKLGVTKIN